MRVQVVTPWYPDIVSAYSGVFVKKQVEAVERMGHSVSVEVPQIYPAPPGKIPTAIAHAIESLASRSVRAVYASHQGVTCVPTPVPSLSGATGRAKAMTDAISLRRRLDPIEADVTHAHLGLPTGRAVLDLKDGRPVIVTEHQSTLSNVLADEQARRLYAATIEESARFFCVSEHLRDELAARLGPGVTDKVEILPNIVDLKDISFRKRERFPFRDWVYVGGLHSHKGVEKLLRTFVDYRRHHDPQATITLVGDGPMRSWVRQFAIARGVIEAVDLVGAVDHGEIGPHLAKSDVMVHLSPAETFGIASLEGIGAGLPVISLRNGGAEAAWGDVEPMCGRILDGQSNPGEIARAIARLRDNPAGLDPEYARKMVETRFGPAVAGRQLVDAYDGALI